MTANDQVPLPPSGARVTTTACDYCIVACGYKVFTWPVGTEGGGLASQNALGVDFPAPALSGRWISPSQHTVVRIGGQPHHAVIIADPDATVVNRGGNHSIRGGTLAQKCYREDGPTRDRLKTPLLRVGGKLTPVSWDTALGVMAGVSKHVLHEHGEMAWGMKTYSYQYFENTYAISKLAFESVKTPCYSEHDKPGPGNDTAGMDDAGLITFSASYEDYSLADVIYISGTDPWETKTVLFTEWMMKGGAKLIFAMPRRTTGVAWAERNGGLFLQVKPGTDTLLHLAMTRLILEQGWQDQEFIDRWVANTWEIDTGFGRGVRNTPWQWRTTWGRSGAVSFEDYKKWLLGYKYAELDRAAEISGVSAGAIRRAAELLSKPVSGKRPKASFCFEKGCYWSNNYLNTASLANLGLVCGAGNRPGQVVSRGGGHQRGWASNAAAYPITQSPEKLPGRRRKEIDLDRWVEAGQLRFAYVIGTTWAQAMAASQELAGTFRRLTRGNPHQIASADASAAVEALKRRVDSGGMAIVHQDIYLVDPIGSELADIVLPAAAWGEDDFTRANGERRMRLYSKFYDPPGAAKPDWWIIAQFARRMGFEGYDWEDSNDVFVEGARFSRGGMLNYHPLVAHAKQLGRRPHELLREMGTTGIQLPARLIKGELVGTKRLHDPSNEIGTPEGPTVHSQWLYAFNTHSGKALLHKTPWEIFADFYERITPKGDEVWVSNGRINEIWQSSFDDQRKPYLKRRFPDTFVEIHPQDAKARGIESGDVVEIWSDDVLVQTGGFVGMEGEDLLSFQQLEQKGHIRVGKGSCRAVAVVTDAVRPGGVFTNFLWPGSPVNSLVHRVPDPITSRYRFKLAKGRLRKVGESPYKRSFEAMTFAPRPVMPRAT
ncbi:MAG: arsenate reductase (azurin) large subunit [Myxococcales bacterium]|nr:arsenate reductase (azurin) large subunit [Myxococcales bacterium]